MKTKKRSLVLVAFTLLIGTQSCYHSFNDAFCIRGSGNIVTEEFFIEDFTQIENNTVVDIEIEQGDEQSVVIEGHANMIDELALNVIGDELHISLINDCYNNFKLKVYITIPVLEELISESTGDIEIGDFSNLKSLYIKAGSTGDIIGTGILDVEDRIEIDGTSTGDIELELYTEDLKVELSGTGDHVFEGSCVYQDIDMDGTADYSAYDLESEICDIICDGTGDAKLNVSEELNVSIKSVGDVYYIGNPTITINDTSIGNLIDAN